MNTLMKKAAVIGGSVALVGASIWGMSAAVNSIDQTPSITSTATPDGGIVFDAPRDAPTADPTPTVDPTTVPAEPTVEPVAPAPVAPPVAPAPAPVKVAPPAAPAPAPAPPAPIRCPAGSQANSNDGTNDTSCFPSQCFTIGPIPNPEHPECDTAFKP